jgi:hypothetical protein
MGKTIFRISIFLLAAGLVFGGIFALVNSQVAQAWTGSQREFGERSGFERDFGEGEERTSGTRPNRAGEQFEQGEAGEIGEMEEIGEFEEGRLGGAFNLAEIGGNLIKIVAVVLLVILAQKGFTLLRRRKAPPV